MEPAVDMGLVKRTIRLAKHNTSIALEAEFWEALENHARRRGCRVQDIITEIDATRTDGLASAIRVAMLTAASQG